MPRPDKVTDVAELTEHFRSSNAAVLTEYRGLTVAQLTQLRSNLGSTAHYAVVKNTLSKIAVRDAGLQELESLLQGPSAIAFIKGDTVEAAKSLRDFAKANPLLVIKGGVLDGKLVTAAELSKIADLESREILLSKVAGAANAALAKAAALFQAPLAQAARVVEALRAQRAENEPAAVVEVPAVIEAPAAIADEAPVAVADEAPAPVADEAPVVVAEASPAVADEPAAAAEPEAPVESPADESPADESPAAE